MLRPNRYRTHTCGELRKSDIGRDVLLSGWISVRRDHGGLVFIDLRDRYGVTQVVFDPERSEKAHELADVLRNEWVICVSGVVSARPADSVNPKMPTGEVEVDVKELTVLSQAKTPPIEIRDDLEANDEIRLQYRYLDLRRGPCQRVFEMRSRANQAIRRYFSDNGFLEIETPFLVKYTPGGARNFLVPARLNPGKFYALAESPQIFKQLLMVAGMDRYFQIVRCFRDEDLRIDRQPEFTQVDVEMSFAEQDDVFAMIEGAVAAVWKDCLGVDVKLPLERMPFDEAMRRFGNDKPDRRFGMEHADLTEIVRKHDGGGVKMLKAAVEGKGIVKGMRVPAQHELPRAQIDKLEQFVKGMGAKGLAWAKLDAQGGWGQAPLAKVIRSELRLALNEALGGKEGDVLFFQFGPAAMVHTVMANLRLHLGRKFGLIPEHGSGGQWDFFWVVDPPLFEYSEEEKKWVAAHHAFTMPREDCLEHLESDPERVKCYRYDLVLNGCEIAGGSIRVHRSDIQSRIFKALGIGDEEAREKFGFLLDAFQFGAPPHGGIALGWDRIVWLVTEAESMREVYAFPKTQKGTDLMTGAPTPVDPKQLKDLGIGLIG